MNELNFYAEKACQPVLPFNNRKNWDEIARCFKDKCCRKLELSNGEELLLNVNIELSFKSQSK